MDMRKRLIITVGLPLSGKSSFAKEYVDSDYAEKTVIVCPDTIRLALHGEQFIGTVEPFVWAIAQVMVRTLLMDGFKVIVDATNTTIERRKMWKAMAKEFGTPLYMWYIKTSEEECLARNEQLERLAPEIILRMARQFQPPTEEEGILIERIF